MARRQSGAILPGINLDRGSSATLARQLEDQLRDVILAGTLAGGSKLPSSRTLAGELGVSRPTVTEALDRLAAEGFLDMRPGAGTFVAGTLPRHLPQGTTQGAARPALAPTPVGVANVSGFGGRLQALDADARLLQTQSESVLHARTAFEIASRQFDNGAISKLALLSAQGQLMQAEIDRIAAQANRYADTSALFHSLGGSEWQGAGKK